MSMDEVDDQRDYAESVEFVPEGFAESLDMLSPETEPEISDNALTEIQPSAIPTGTGEDEPPAGEVDVKPKIDPETLAADMEKLKERLEKTEKQAGYWRRQAEKTAKELPPVVETPATTEPEKKKPIITDFDSDEEYFEALADFKTDIKLAQFRAENEASRQIVEKQSFEQKMFADGIEKFTDFQDVVQDPTLPITTTIIEALRVTEIPAEIVYYLGKNPAETARISRLNPLAVAREIGFIEAKLAASKEAVVPGTPQPPTVKKTSNAPPPINPIRGGSSVSVGKNPENMTNAEYRKWRMGG